MVKDLGIELNTYSYLDEAGTGLNFDAMIDDIRNIPDGYAILLHAVAHNPTGVDPTDDNWRELLEVIKKKKLFIFFDCAYQGFVSGDPEVDAFAVRLFAQQGMEMVVACSFSKNFGLYGERTGALHVVSSNQKSLKSCASQLRAISRVLYSTCPSFGARIVATVLNNPESKAQWQSECWMMANRLNEVRKDLHDQLTAANVRGYLGPCDQTTRHVLLHWLVRGSGKEIEGRLPYLHAHRWTHQSSRAQQKQHPSLREGSSGVSRDELEHR